MPAPPAEEARRRARAPPFIAFPARPAASREPAATATVLQTGQRRLGPIGVSDIEIRTLAAYGLILIAAAVVLFGIVVTRYNSRDRKIRRQRERERDRVQLDDEEHPSGA